MKNRIATAIAAVFIASIGTAAYAQQTNPQPTTPAQQQQMPQQQPMPPASAPPANNMEQSNQGTASGSQVEQKIRHELASHGVTATDVNVSFNNGTATLSGSVATQKDVSKAKRAAMRVHGVKQVDTSNLHASAHHASQTPGQG